MKAATTHHEIALRDISIRTEQEPYLSAVLGDPVQLKRVLANLIINAIEATIVARALGYNSGYTTKHEDGGFRPR